jgi:magnesium-transporting ATPase (P-type)
MFLTLAAHDVGRIFDNATKTGDSPSRSRDIILNNDGFLGLFLHLGVVMSSFTQFVFWLLSYIDREMILPETVAMPAFLNHMLHTFPLFFVLVAVNIFASNFPNTREERNCRTIAWTGVIKFVGFVAFVYLTLIWILFEVRGVCRPYPFMFSFSRVDYIIFSSCALLFSFILCYICSFIEIKIKNLNIL